MNKNKFDFPIGAIIGVFIIIAAFGILAFTILEDRISLDTNVQKSPTPTPFQSPTPPPTPIPTPESTPADDYQTVEEDNFNISFPAEWRLEGTVIHNSQEEKVAEFSPGTITPTEETACTEIFDKTINGGEALELEEGFSYSFLRPLGEESVLNQEIKTISGRDWALLAYETIPDGVREPEPWYPHQYCTASESGQKLFLITFYERSEGQTTLPQEPILSTFQFTGSSLEDEFTE